MKSCELLLPLPSGSFLLVGLLRGLGRLALHNLGGGGLDDADSHGLPHVTDSEPGEIKVRKVGDQLVGIVFTSREEGSP